MCIVIDADAEAGAGVSGKGFMDLKGDPAVTGTDGLTKLLPGSHSALRFEGGVQP